MYMVHCAQWWASWSIAAPATPGEERADCVCTLQDPRITVIAFHINMGICGSIEV